MRDATLETPVLLLLYDRPELTRRVFERIREVRPRRLYLVADGPREGSVDDSRRCAEARAVVEAVDWPAEVRRDFAERNLGCKHRVASGLDWFFGEVERGIVLEDDCLPHPSFFSFCERMLDRYERDERVMHVCGSSFAEAAGPAPYAYSIYPTVWGWASWRRAWRHYDLALAGYPEFRRSGGLGRLFPRGLERTFWADTLHRMHRGEIDTWDHAWTFALWRRGAVAVVPRVNLVENLGVVGGAHMRPGRGRPPRLHPQGIDPDALCAPPRFEVDRRADTRTWRAFLRFFSLRARLRLVWRTLRGGHAAGA